jgi:hypothetical protein
MIFLQVISVLIFIFAIARAGEKHKGTIALVAVMLNGFLSSSIAISALTGSPFSKILRSGLTDYRHGSSCLPILHLSPASCMAVNT